MNRLFKKFIAFSLVELMISLITISLITAAFAPVITKKLSAGTITVGSFGGGGGSSMDMSEIFNIKKMIQLIYYMLLYPDIQKIFII